ncbi:exodeoxyribonuclease V subunit alpha [Nocardia sp. CDC159]|uniref:RecBCD enzyme subunit RecD n=1 Tax=Nocardia pulmonis TaxID=2951408 RepID=A0A9X2E3Q7_9NOCA|nr:MULTISPECIES: exodeoxyribonuclease V subunit alpha [Nocardia]MCM6772260.1 exodeoxyribonuclease V subunit alpha [Nocardia pulmonis]MCM6785082.1 exodeoxyribonuclease V subunit alpha [Nocardia sp. CDC159]
MTSIQLAQRATGLLRTFNAAGILSAADVHVALRLGRLGREDCEAVLLATALAVRAVRSGSVCLELPRMHDIGVDGEGFDADDPEAIDPATLPWPEVDAVLTALRASPLVQGSPAGPLRPLRLVEPEGGAPLLYLDRYYRQEQTIRDALTARAATHPLIDPKTVREQLDRLFPDSHRPGEPPDRQRVAAALAATHWTTVVAGGPGTGKTHTIARILALLVALQRAVPGAPAPRIALAAPTGKAAARLQESVREQAAGLDLPELTAATLHRLLGWQRGGPTRFRHHEFNRLPYDVIVIDETSMVSLTMMSRLLPAVRSDTRLVLVGDPDQLASVDAGAVLADLVAGPVVGQPNPLLDQVLGEDAAAAAHPDALTARERDRLRGGIIRLTRGRRFGGRIAELAVAVRAGDADTALALLAEGGAELSLCDPDEVADVRADVVRAARDSTAAAERGEAAAALAAMESHRLLCAHRQGQFGVERWDRLAAGWVAAAGIGVDAGAGQWFAGQPLLVTANDHEARIYNGDTGVIVRAGDGTLRAALQRGSEPYLVHPTQFPGVTTVYAMTIHRSQGSQYGTVSVVLPGAESTLLTRELLYTAITRARHRVRVIGTEDAIRAGIGRRVLRASGLRT